MGQSKELHECPLTRLMRRPVPPRRPERPPIRAGPWPVVPGLVLAGAGLSLLVIPLANVVLAAVPSQAAGGAGGLFSTAQQLGGAVIGTIFFSQLGTHSFTQAFTHGLPVAAGLFLASAALSLLLPKTAVADEFG
jgi:hypothetical protein